MWATFSELIRQIDKTVAFRGKQQGARKHAIRFIRLLYTLF